MFSNEQFMADRNRKFNYRRINPPEVNSPVRVFPACVMLALSVLISVPVLSLAQTVPSMISFQGRLTDTLNNPLEGSHDLVFKIYSAAAGGSPLWSETQNGIQASNGTFAAQVGGVTPIPAAVFGGAAAYLEITVDGTTLSPREQLITVPYAFNSQLLEGKDFTAFVSTYTSQTIQGTKTFSGPLNINSSAGLATTNQPYLNISTNVVLSASQFRFGNFAAAPSATALGKGAVYYNTNADSLYVSNGSGWVQLAAGGVSPWGEGAGAVTLNSGTNKVGVGKAPAEKLDVAGNIKADYGVMAATAVFSGGGAEALTVVGGIKAGGVNIIGVDGKIPSLGAAYFADLDGSGLTGLNASSLSSGTVPSAALSGIYGNALTFGSAAGGPISFSTNVVIPASQVRLGNFTSAPTAIGVGAIYYNTTDQQLYYSNNGLSWNPLASGGISPWTGGGSGAVTLGVSSDKVGIGGAPGEKLHVYGNIKAESGISAATMALSDVGADALTVAGGIKAGGVSIIGADGRIPALTGIYLSNLDGSALTNVNSAQFGLVAAATTTIAGSLNSEIINRVNAYSALSARFDAVAVDTSAVAAALAGKAGTGANTFTGVQTYGSGASITAAANSPGVTISTGIFVGGVAVFPESGTTLVANGDTLAVDRAFMKVAGNGGPAVLNAVTGIAPGTSGQVVILAGTSNTNTVRFTSSGNIQLSGGVPYTLAQNGMITLLYNGAKWVELNNGR